MSFKHITPIQIRFNDIDLAGHVYNAVYQEYFDLARVSYFNTILGHLLSWEKTGLVIVSIHIDYSFPIYLGDKVEIHSRVSSLGEKSLEMIQHVFKNEESEPIAYSKTVLVCFDMPYRESIEIPEEWRNKIMKFEQI